MHLAELNPPARKIYYFQYSIGDAWLVEHNAKFYCAYCFQYSIGDAGGSCPWFLWVFKFLYWRVWVSAGACWLWLFWFGLCVSVLGVEVWVSACFFSSASACAEKLHDVL